MDIWDTEYHYLPIRWEDPPPCNTVIDRKVDPPRRNCGKRAVAVGGYGLGGDESLALTRFHDEDNKFASDYLCADCLRYMLNDPQEWEGEDKEESQCYQAQIKLILDNLETPSGLSVNKVRELLHG